MPLDLEALETSFDLIAPRGDELMDRFYARLFAAAPAVRPLFAGTDLRRQKAMLLSALVLLRKSLRDLDAIVPKLRAPRSAARRLRRAARALSRSSAARSSPRWPRWPATAWRPEYERAWARRVRRRRRGDARRRVRPASTLAA